MTKEASSEQDLPLPPSHHAPPTPPPPPPKEEEEEEEDKRKRGRSSSVDSVDSVDSLGRIKRRRVRIGNGSDDDEDEDDDDLERRRGRRGRNGGVWRNRSRSRSRSRERRRTNERDDAVKGSLREDKKKEEEEEPEGGATMPLPPPSGVPDTRSAVKIFADAPPSEVALAPPPPRRRRRPDAKKPTTAATAITTDAIAAAAAPVPTPVPGSIPYVPTAPVASTGTCTAAAISPSEQQQQELSSLSPKGGRSQRAPVSPTRGKRPPPPPAAAVLPLPTRPLPQEKREEEEEEEDDDLMFETEKEREEREMAERRARREKMLAQFGGADVTARGDEKDRSGGKSTKCPPPLVLSPAVPTCSLPTLVQEKKEKWHAGTATAAVPAMASATADTAAAAIAPPAGKKKTKETEKEKEEAMRIFLAETRRQVEDALGGAGELMMEDVEEDEEERNEGTDGADEVMKHEEEEEDEVEKEKGVGAATVAADTAAAAAAAAAGGGGAVELDIFSAEGASRLTQSLLKDGGTRGGLGALGKAALKEQRDAEGYLSHRVGEILHGRYKILGTKGRGIFSSVLLAQDEQAQAKLPLRPSGLPSLPHSPSTVAIKVLRGNELMLQAGMKEAAILRDLTLGDPKNQGHIVRFLDDFRLGEHVCVVMEAMHMNLRKLLKTYGASQGLAVKAVLSYTQQLLIGLAYLQQKGIIHADLKPDNLVVNSSMSLLKICDFGSALRVHEINDKEEDSLATVPYLQSRFYRAPEVMLALPPRGTPIDMWSAGASMFEMYTGRVLFDGRNNNEVLMQMMEVRGGFSKRVLKKCVSSIRKKHFDEDGMFLQRELAERGESVRSVPPPTVPRKQLGELLCSPKVWAKMPAETRGGVTLLRFVLEQALVLDPSKRATPLQALQLFKERSGGGGGERGGK